MKPDVLLTYLTTDTSGNSVNAIKSIIKSQSADTDFSLLTCPGSELSDFARNSNIPLYETATLSGKSSILSLLKAAGFLQDTYKQKPFDIVHIHSDTDHKACCLWKILYKPPIKMIRTRLVHKAVPKNKLNSLLFNKMVSVNLFPSRELMDLYRDSSGGAMKMDNPYVVENYPDLSGDSAEMMKHCYRSLVSLSYFHTRDYGLHDWSHISLSYIVPIYISQKSPDAILNLLHRYEKYSCSLLDKIHFVIIDDCSPIKYDIPQLDLNITWIRINEDIPWNQPGARNLGAIYAKSDNILMTDLDFEYPEETLRAMAGTKGCGRNFYKIRVKDLETGRVGKGHANNFFMSRARFLRFFGYDEEFCGHHGADDFRFVKYHKAQGSRQLNLNEKYFCHRRNDLKGSKSFHSLKRDMSFNTPVDSRKKFEMDIYGHEAGQSRNFLNFTWEKMYEHKRVVTLSPPEDRLWKKLWYWRWLVGSK